MFLYSLRSGKRSRLGQGHGLQSTTLTSLFLKNIYWKVIYVYFYEKDFRNKSIDMFHISKLNDLKIIHIYILNVWLKPYPKRLL
jgi:hypothetical protein